VIPSSQQSSFPSSVVNATTCFGPNTIFRWYTWLSEERTASAYPSRHCSTAIWRHSVTTRNPVDLLFYNLFPALGISFWSALCLLWPTVLGTASARLAQMWNIHSSTRQRNRKSYLGSLSSLWVQNRSQNITYVHALRGVQRSGGRSECSRTLFQSAGTLSPDSWNWTLLKGQKVKNRNKNKTISVTGLGGL
jgi:hypothetical protein